MSRDLKATITFKDNTRAVETGIGNFLQTAIAKSLAVMERNIKVIAPFKHGHLRRSIQNRMTSPTSGEVFTGSVEGGQPIDYAVYQEYGTKHIAPRAFMRKGVAASEDRIKQIFGEEARKVRASVPDIR